MLLELDGFSEDILGTAAVSLRSTLKYRRNWNKNGPTVQLLRKMMPRGSKGFRVYLPIGAHTMRPQVVVPLQVRLAIKQAGFRITDYLAKKCVKIADKEQKNVFNIGKVISKDAVAKAAFDNDPQLQNSKHTEFTMVVSCHPYDIIGMSTGRSWDEESCMRLKDFRSEYSEGVNSHYVERDVAEGTLVAYAVRTEDTNIEKPLGRCLLKPFVRADGKDDIMYRRETTIYGNPVPGFADTLQFFLRKLNSGIPAGIYRLNSELYNDGVGRAVEHEDSNEAVLAGGGVDWGMVDREAKLEERPELFPSYISYMIKHYKEKTFHASSVIREALEKSHNMPTQICRQVGRLIAADEGLVTAFLKTIKIADEGSELAGRLLKSKDLRDAIGKKRESLTWLKSSQTATLFSKKDAHNYFEQMDKTTEKYWDVAYALLDGQMAMSAKDIESIPELHKIIYFVATLCREASVFDFEINQETAHRLLSTLSPADNKIDDSMLRRFKDFLRFYEDYRIPAAAHVLTLLKQGDDETANAIAMSITNQGFTEIMKSRKFSRRFLSLKNPPKGIALLIMSAVAALMDNHAGNDEGVAREIGLQIDRMKVIDAILPRTYYDILRVAPNLYGKLYFSDFRVGPTLINDAIRYLPIVEGGHSAYAYVVRDHNKKLLDGEGTEKRDLILTPVNDEQKQLWDLHGALLHMSSHTQSEIVVDYDPDKWVDLMAANIGEIRRLDQMQIDLQRFPQLLHPDTAESLTPIQFIGKDKGMTMCDQAAKQGLFALSDIIGMVFNKDALEVVRTAYTGQRGSGHKIIHDISDMYKSGDMEGIQKLYDFAYNYAETVDSFLDRLIPPTPAETLPWLAEALDQPIEKMQEGAPAILGLMTTLNKVRQDLPSVTRVFEVVVPEAPIKYGPNPRYRLPAQ